MIICTVGVFIDIAVITVAPIALAIGKKVGYNKASLLLAMIGGETITFFSSSYCRAKYCCFIIGNASIVFGCHGPLIAPPLGGSVCAIACGKITKFVGYMEF